MDLHGRNPLKESDLTKAEFLFIVDLADQWHPDNILTESLLPYQINTQPMGATGHPDSTFMHCLPARHNTEAAIIATIGG